MLLRTCAHVTCTGQNVLTSKTISYLNSARSCGTMQRRINNSACFCSVMYDINFEKRETRLPGHRKRKVCQVEIGQPRNRQTIEIVFGLAFPQSVVHDTSSHLGAHVLAMMMSMHHVPILVETRQIHMLCFSHFFLFPAEGCAQEVFCHVVHTAERQVENRYWWY